ncbi:hypothetical protein EDD22DRAFT_901127 [Suillus occidentalis]|nr:hypothetical protein EDD22DRAFT_901127 [Suillus occidentalis]
MLSVIMIARLHAMYQGSRTMLLFLVIIFLAVNIACVVLAAIALKTIVWGNYEGNIELLAFNGLDAQHCLGGPRTVSFGLDCCETLPRPATPRPIDRIDDRGLSQSADEIPRALFCKVSL